MFTVQPLLSLEFITGLLQFSTESNRFKNKTHVNWISLPQKSEKTEIHQRHSSSSIAIIVLSF